MYPECLDEVRARGLCHRHYSTALRLVNEYRTTWGELERTGKSKSGMTYQRQGQGKVTKWFMEAEQPLSHDKYSSLVEGGLAERPDPAK